MRLSVENVTKRFSAKGTAAVLGASFEAAPGGVTTLLGPSGSGKTTLLRIVAGLERADEGRVLVDGADVTATPVGKRRFGFVFQSFALFAHMTVWENVAFGLLAQGARREQIEARVKELLEMVRLEGYADRYPGQLSGGQRQRVGFARALAPYPKLLLLDEPFGALDARVRVELRAFLRDLHRQTHLTTLLVTHDQDEALELSDRVVVMDKGEIQQVGSPEEIYDHPRTAFVASFVGTANVLPARVREGRAHLDAFAELSASPLRSDLPDGTVVRAIVRPHDVKVRRAEEGAHGRALGTVTRLAPLGALVKLQVALSEAEHVQVELPREEAGRLALSVGDKVLVDVAAGRVYEEEYAT